MTRPSRKPMLSRRPPPIVAPPTSGPLPYATPRKGQSTLKRSWVLFKYNYFHDATNIVFFIFATLIILALLALRFGPRIAWMLGVPND